MNQNYRDLVSKLDLCGLPQREEKRVQKQEQAQQQVAFDGAAAARRGLRSYLSEAYREARFDRLKDDPAAIFFLTKNRDPSSA